MTGPSVEHLGGKSPQRMTNAPTQVPNKRLLFSPRDGCKDPFGGFLGDSNREAEGFGEDRRVGGCLGGWVSGEREGVAEGNDFPGDW